MLFIYYDFSVCRIIFSIIKKKLIAKVKCPILGHILRTFQTNGVFKINNRNSLELFLSNYKFALYFIILCKDKDTYMLFYIEKVSLKYVYKIAIVGHPIRTNTNTWT